MTDERNLKYLINKAYNILNNCGENTHFSENKEVIKGLFLSTEKSENKEFIRLSVIDSFYSTNMGKSIGGISQLSKEMKSLSNDDKELSNIFKNYLTGNKELNKILSKKYGITNERSAVSLISKYGYFLTGFNFPIYDRLVRKVLTRFYRLKIIETKFTNNINYMNFFKRLNDVIIELDMDNLQEKYDKLDAFSWLIGKIPSKNIKHLIDNEKQEDFNNFAKILKYLEVLKDSDFICGESDVDLMNLLQIKNPKKKKDNESDG